MVKIGIKKVSQTLLSLKQVSTDAAADLQLLFNLLKEKCCLLTTKRRGKTSTYSESGLYQFCYFIKEQNPLHGLSKTAIYIL